MNEAQVNKKYKDKVFCLLFGSREYKENLLSLYNALNDSDYTDLSGLKINTIEDVIYMGYRNDVSFICEAENFMYLYEHQSTYNPNIPLRGIFYFSKLYSKLLSPNKEELYSSKKITVPTPKFYVFYNGRKDTEDKVEFKFSDMYMGEGDLECKATLLNINLGHNKELLSKCQTLNEYSSFVEKVYQNSYKYANIQDKNEREIVMRRVMDEVIDECIDNNVLRDFLLAHRAEVRDVILTEYDQEEHMKIIERDAKEEGMKEGREDLIIEMVRDGDITLAKAAEKLDISEEELKSLL